MIAIRKAWWATLLLTAFAGCTNEEPMGENPAPPPPSSADGGMPPATPPADVPAKEGMGADMSKDETPKVEAPKDEAPKDEGLKLDAPAVTPPPAKDEAGEKKDEPKEADAGSSLTADELVELASLSPADKAIALKQLVCPVSGEHLGSMGKPLKVSAEGKTFMLCCDGCKGEVKDNPKEVVAKLKK